MLKRWWWALAAVVLAILGAILKWFPGVIAKLFAKPYVPPVMPPTAEQIQRETEATIAEVRDQIRTDSDQALADRFNAAVKKEKL